MTEEIKKEPKEVKERKQLESFSLEPTLKHKLAALSKELSEKRGFFVSNASLIREGIVHILKEHGYLPT